MKLTFHKATVADIDILTKTRIEVLRSANNLSDDVDMSLVELESYKYYQNCFEKDDHVAYLVYDGDNFAGCGGISFYEVMPTYSNPSGKNAYIMNMYTRLEYRRSGIASKTLDLLIQEAKKRGIKKISLEATEMGRTVYEKYGFAAMRDEMEYPHPASGSYS
jgi:GNAT superfamily N-acetyltransferase